MAIAFMAKDTQSKKAYLIPSKMNPIAKKIYRILGYLLLGSYFVRLYFGARHNILA